MPKVEMLTPDGSSRVTVDAAEREDKEAEGFIFVDVVPEGAPTASAEPEDAEAVGEVEPAEDGDEPEEQYSAADVVTMGHVEAKGAIAEMTDVEQLREVVENDRRSTVKATAIARIQQLEQAADGGGEGE